MLDDADVGLPAVGTAHLAGGQSMTLLPKKPLTATPPTTGDAPSRHACSGVAAPAGSPSTVEAAAVMVDAEVEALVNDEKGVTKTGRKRGP